MRMSAFYRRSMKPGDANIHLSMVVLESGGFAFISGSVISRDFSST